MCVRACARARVCLCMCARVNVNLFVSVDSIMFQYFVKVVPTSYHRLSGEVRSDLGR